MTNIIKNYYENIVSERKRRRLGMFERDPESQKSGVPENKMSKNLLEGIEKVSFNESYF